MDVPREISSPTRLDFCFFCHMKSSGGEVEAEVAVNTDPCWSATPEASSSARLCEDELKIRITRPTITGESRSN